MSWREDVYTFYSLFIDTEGFSGVLGYRAADFSVRAWNMPESALCL